MCYLVYVGVSATEVLHTSTKNMNLFNPVAYDYVK